MWEFEIQGLTLCKNILQTLSFQGFWVQTLGLVYLSCSWNCSKTVSLTDLKETPQAFLTILDSNVSFCLAFYPWSWRPGSSHCWKWSCGFLRSTSPPSHLKVHDCLARSLEKRWWFPGWKVSQTAGSLLGKAQSNAQRTTLLWLLKRRQADDF